MADNSRNHLSYKLLVIWRKLVYKRILADVALTRFSKSYLSVSAKLLGFIICLINPRNGRTKRYMENWKTQTSALFSPQITPMSVYTTSSTDALIALNQCNFTNKGKVIFFSHGAHLIQNVSCVLIDLAAKSEQPYINVLIFRRQRYTHVEQWWIEYALCFRINVQIVHEDTLLLIDKAKAMLDNNEIVLCAPDFFFSEEQSYAASWESFRKTATLFMRMAKQKQAETFYINGCLKADYTDIKSVLKPITDYNSETVAQYFQDEINKDPERWFFSYNHYDHMQLWNSNPA